MSNPLTLVETTVVPHTAFVKAKEQLALSFKYAANQAEAQGIAIVGESGTGKTSVLDCFSEQYPSRREPDGRVVPILRATVPSNPTVKSLAGVMLDALGADDSERGTENEKTKRLRVLIKNTGVVMVMLDEFQHFYDKGKRQIMYHVADWLKVLIDSTRCTLVVAGLPVCRVVIEQNEQLERRFLASLQMPRFDWNDANHRAEFMGIIEAFNSTLSSRFRIPELHSDSMAFRFYCATGGLMSLVSKLLRHAERKAESEGRRTMNLHDFHIAHMESIWLNGRKSEAPKPFEETFNPIPTYELLDSVRSIGKAAEQAADSTTPRYRPARESIDSILRKRSR
jgi:hypothetical protein